MGYTDLAREVAFEAHQGAFRADGAPYITHPEAVATILTGEGYDDLTVAAGWLHDTVEDTPLTFEDLLGLGFPPVLVSAVDALTIRDGEAHADAVRRAAGNPISCPVKNADRRHNGSPDQLRVFPSEVRTRKTIKYTIAGEILMPALYHFQTHGLLRFAGVRSL